MVAEEAVRDATISSLSFRFVYFIAPVHPISLSEVMHTHLHQILPVMSIFTGMHEYPSRKLSLKLCLTRTTTKQTRSIVVLMQDISVSLLPIIIIILQLVHSLSEIDRFL